MDQVTNGILKRGAGGDARTPQAKLESARREQQIVALRLRGVSFFEIGRRLDITRQSAHRAFLKALRRNTDQDIQTHHRAELGKLDMEETNVWRAMDANKEDWRAQMAGTAQLRGIHVRRAKLLGLDAPTKLDVRGLYRTGIDESRPNGRRAGPSSRHCPSRNSAASMMFSTKRGCAPKLATSPNPLSKRR